MKNIGRICLLFFLLSCCVKCWAEPSYQEKPLSVWLENYGASPRNYKPSPEADEALRHIGPEAVPYLLELLRKTNTPAVDEELRQIGAGVLTGTNSSNFTPASWFHWKAYLSFQALGPAGKSAIPDLERLAHDDPNGTSFYPNIYGMKHIAWVAASANNSSSYVAPGDGPFFDDGTATRNTNHVFFGDRLMRDTKPFLVDGEIAAWSLAAIGADAVPSLMELLNDPSPHLRQRAVEALGLVGAAAEPAVPAIIKNLEGSDFEVRQRAADALGCIGRQPELAIPALTTALKDSDVGVQIYAAQSLGSFQESATNAIPALLANFAASDYRTKQSAASALSKISRETTVKEVIPVLLRDLKDSRSNFRNTALITLSQMHDEPDLVIPALIDALDDSDEMVRYNAVHSLGSFGSQAKAAVSKLINLTVRTQQIHEEAIRALGKIDPTVQIGN